MSLTLLCRCKRPPVSFNAATAVFHAHSLLGSRPSRTLSAMPCKLTRNCSAHNQCVIFSAKLVVLLCVSVLPIKDDSYLIGTTCQQAYLRGHSCAVTLQDSAVCCHAIPRHIVLQRLYSCGIPLAGVHVARPCTPLRIGSMRSVLNRQSDSQRPISRSTYCGPQRCQSIHEQHCPAMNCRPNPALLTAINSKLHCHRIKA